MHREHILTYDEIERRWQNLFDDYGLNPCSARELSTLSTLDDETRKDIVKDFFGIPKHETTYIFQGSEPYFPNGNAVAKVVNRIFDLCSEPMPSVEARKLTDEDKIEIASLFRNYLNMIQCCTDSPSFHQQISHDLGSVRDAGGSEIRVARDYLSDFIYELAFNTLPSILNIDILQYFALYELVRDPVETGKNDNPAEPLIQIYEKGVVPYGYQEPVLIVHAKARDDIIDRILSLLDIDSNPRIKPVEIEIPEN